MWSYFRATTKTRPEARLLGRCRGAKETTVFEFGSARRTNRPAIDARGTDSHEYATVKSRVSALQSLVANFRAGQLHVFILTQPRPLNSRFSDLIISWIPDTTQCCSVRRRQRPPYLRPHTCEIVDINEQDVAREDVPLKQWNVQ